MFIYRAPLNKAFYAVLQNYASQHIILSQCKTYRWFREYLDFLVPQFLEIYGRSQFGTERAVRVPSVINCW